MALALGLAGCGGEKVATGSPLAAGSDAGSPTGPVVSDPSRPVSSGSTQPALPAPVAGAKLDATGWVLQPPFYAAGQEPYWRLNIEDGWFVFRRSGLPEIEAPIPQPKKVGGADVFETPPLKVSIKRAACETSEGQKGDVVAIVSFDDNDYDGCAYGGAQQAAGASAEAELVSGAVKVIDACLKKASEPALITAIYPREGDRMAAAVKTKDGTLYECAVEPSGEIAFFDEQEPGTAGP
jgi:uncharacterized membrane protein